MSKGRSILFILLGVIASFLVYVGISNRNQPQMSFRQKILRTIYPALMWVTRLSGKNTTVLMRSGIDPRNSLYDLSIQTVSGDSLPLANFRGKYLLIVNTASDCGYTAQYAELQQLYAQYGDKLTIIGVPSNEFKEQEKGTATDIENFCKRNYGVTFILLEKSIVKKDAEQHPVYQWLTDSQKNGWNTQGPSWNFSKYLIDEQGRLTHYMDPSVSPLDTRVVRAITH